MKRAVFLALALFAACAPTIPKPTPIDAQRAGTTIEVLDAGRTTYVRRCGNCHSLYPPSEYASTVWPGKVAAMRIKAKLAPTDETQIVRYLQTLASRP